METVARLRGALLDTAIERASLLDRLDDQEEALAEQEALRGAIEEARQAVSVAEERHDEAVGRADRADLEIALLQASLADSVRRRDLDREAAARSLREAHGRWSADRRRWQESARCLLEEVSAGRQAARLREDEPPPTAEVAAGPKAEDDRPQLLDELDRLRFRLVEQDEARARHDRELQEALIRADAATLDREALTARLDRIEGQCRRLEADRDQAIDRERQAIAAIQEERQRSEEQIQRLSQEALEASTDRDRLRLALVEAESVTRSALADRKALEDRLAARDKGESTPRGIPEKTPDRAEPESAASPPPNDRSASRNVDTPAGARDRASWIDLALASWESSG